MRKTENFKFRAILSTLLSITNCRLSFKQVEIVFPTYHPDWKLNVNHTQLPTVSIIKQNDSRNTGKIWRGTGSRESSRISSTGVRITVITQYNSRYTWLLHIFFFFFFLRGEQLITIIRAGWTTFSIVFISLRLYTSLGPITLARWLNKKKKKKKDARLFNRVSLSDKTVITAGCKLEKHISRSSRPDFMAESLEYREFKIWSNFVFYANYILARKKSILQKIWYNM